jgi:hypothetical protein
MSGHAASALVLSEDRGQVAQLKLYPSGEHLPPSPGESPLPLDCYLSWMSPGFVPSAPAAPVNASDLISVRRFMFPPWAPEKIVSSGHMFPRLER